MAIADVDATVSMGSAIDGHAQANTTSVYTAAGIFPMLPEKLSTDLTSLAEGEERLAVVIEMDVDPDGAVIGSDIYRALVMNCAKLAYNGVAAWLEGTGPAPSRVSSVPGLAEQLRMQDRVAQALEAGTTRARRAGPRDARGRPVFEDGALSDLEPDAKNRAKELIEDFMVAANGVTRGLSRRQGFPSLRRVLRSPERWERIVELAAGLGGTCRQRPMPLRSMHSSCSAAKRIPRFPDLSLSVVKLLGRASTCSSCRASAAEGHFGLAVRDYTHSTAPNRRFPDLITQRLLKAALAGRPSPYTDDELAALASHCTEQEDNAAKVERQVRKSAAALLLASRIGEQFDAIVTGASAKGTWVRISGPTVEGQSRARVRGPGRRRPVRVKLVHTDVERGFIDFSAPSAAT